MAVKQQGILQAVFNLDNQINLNRAFASPSEIRNPVMKSIDAKGNTINASSIVYLNYSNENLEHLPKLKCNVGFNSPFYSTKIKYLNISFPSQTGCTFGSIDKLEKIDSENIIKSEHDQFNTDLSLKELPKLNLNQASNNNLSSFITKATNLKPTTIDLSENNTLKQLGIYGDSTHIVSTLDGIKVSTEAPFDGTIPQIDTSYTSLDKNGIVNLFNTLPYNIGYQVIGNPTIEDGIASGFSQNDYVITSDGLYSQPNIIEVQTKFTLNNISGQQWVFSGKTKTHIFNIGIANGKKLWIIFGKGDVSGETKQISYGTAIEGETVYARAIITQNQAEGFYSSNGNDWISIGSIDLTNDPILFDLNKNFYIGYPYLEPNKFFTGLIDLNETYIKVNSIVSTGPVNYTVVGNPTISNGILYAPCDSNNYLQFSDAFRLETPFELVMRLKPGTSNSGGNIFTGGTGQNCYIRFRNTVLFAHMGSGKDLSISSTFDTNTFYFIRLRNVAGTFYLGYSLDGQTWVEQSATFTGLATFSHMKIGVNTYGSNNGYNGGGIDLNQTYIKVNGKLWFGHESKQVTWFKGLPATSKVIKILGSTGESSLTNDDRAIATNKGWYINEETVYNSFPENLPINF